MKNKLLAGVILGIIVGVVGYWGVGEYMATKRENAAKEVVEGLSRTKNKSAYLREYSMQFAKKSSIELSNSSAHDQTQCDGIWYNIVGIDQLRSAAIESGTATEEFLDFTISEQAKLANEWIENCTI